MKKLLLAVMLIPALAAAEEAKVENEPGIEAPKQTAETATATATPAEGEKKDEKKDEKPAATATTTQTAATGTTINASLATPEQLAAAGKWVFSLNLDNSVGSGTFANAAYYASVVSSLSGGVQRPFQLFNKNFSASAGVGLNYEFSTPDAVNARRVSWGDGRLGLAMPGVFKESVTGISVTPSVGLSVPLTMESWYSGNISNLRASVSANRAFGPVSVRAGLGGGYTLNTSSYVVQRPTNNVITNGGPICRLSDPPGSCGSGGLTSKANYSVSLGAVWGINDALSLSGSYGISGRWRNAASWDPNDPYTPKGVQVNGESVANTGYGLSNAQSGAISLSYQLTDIFSVSGSVSNDGPLLTNDNKAIRFPFFDTLSVENSLTAYTISLSATL